jgi:hypothetical protein
MLCPDEWAERLQQVMELHHKDHLGLVGAASSIRTPNARYLVDWLVREVWSRYAALDVSDEVIGSLITEFGRYIDATRIRLRYTAPILNLTVEPDVAEIPLPAAVTIKQLTDAELTELYGGPLYDPLSFGRGDRGEWGRTWYAFVGEFSESKCFASEAAGPSLEVQQVQNDLQRAVLALRTFKSGPVGCRRLYIEPVDLCPVIPFDLDTGQREHVPSGRYALRADEVDCLRAHVGSIVTAERLHPALDLATMRLSDAETRTSPRDKVIDAVIGLEAVLLDTHRDEPYRQELRYRFATNYASLVDTPEERLSRFRLAKDIYDCRSQLAHGARVAEDKVKVGEARLTLSQTAEIACKMLREIVKRFLPQGDRPVFCRDYYWEERLFGLEHPA